jgi:hypothetical protein
MTKRSFRAVKGQDPEYPKRSILPVGTRELLAGLGAAAALAAAQACGIGETTGGVPLAPDDAQIVDSADAGQDAGTDAGEPETTGGVAPTADGGE